MVWCLSVWSGLTYVIQSYLYAGQMLMHIYSSLHVQKCSGRVKLAVIVG